MKTQKKLNQICLTVLLTAMAACSAKVETPQAVPPGGGNDQQGESQGPFSIVFDSNNTYTHNLKININQTEGKVEYKLNAGQRIDLVLEESQSLVTGCDAAAVKHEIFWLPDENSTTYAQILKLNSKFFTARKTQGVLIQSFKNLQNCTDIEIKTKLRKETKTTKLGQVCEGFSTPEQCKLLSYCKEKNVSSLYYEVEVWNQQGVYTAKKFLVRADGTRGLMSSYSVSFSDSAAFAKINSTLDTNFSLKINNITYDGVATENINGQTYSLSLACEL